MNVFHLDLHAHRISSRVKSNSVKFFGCVYDKHRAHPELSKVSTIKEMTAPQNKGELQSLFGMVTYLSPFILKLSSHTLTFRGLLKTDFKYSWNATYRVAFNKLKSLVCVTLDMLGSFSLGPIWFPTNTF